jgi:hypothetical protein
VDKTQARQRILALFTTLANDKPVVSDWNMGQRNVEYRDVFALLNNSYTQAVCGGTALTLRIDNRKDGQVTLGRAEACSWSIDALVDYAQNMTEEEAAQLDAPCERRGAVQKLAKLLDEGKACVNGKNYSCLWADVEDLGERYAVHTNAMSEDYGADELLTTS